MNREHDSDGEESALDRLRGWLSSPTQPETGSTGEIEVTEEDGAVRQLQVAKGKRPWWQTSTTPRTGFLLGLLWLALTVVRIVSDGWPAHGVLGWIMLVVSAVLATCYLVSAALLRRRQRSTRTSARELG